MRPRCHSTVKLASSWSLTSPRLHGATLGLTTDKRARVRELQSTQLPVQCKCRKNTQKKNLDQAQIKTHQTVYFAIAGKPRHVCVWGGGGACVRACVRACVYVCVSVCLCLSVIVCVRAHTYLHARTHTNTHTRAHARRSAHECVHMCGIYAWVCTFKHT